MVRAHEMGNRCALRRGCTMEAWATWAVGPHNGEPILMHVEGMLHGWLVGLPGVCPCGGFLGAQRARRWPRCHRDPGAFPSLVVPSPLGGFGPWAVRLGTTALLCPS